MHDNKLIKKIWGLSRYDFMNNMTNWLTITGVLATTCIALFSIGCYLTSTYLIHLWTLPKMLFADLHLVWTRFITSIANQTQFSSQPWFFQYLFNGLVWLVENIVSLLFFIIILQNCLDLAFDSAMSGFTKFAKKDLFAQFLLMQILFVGINFSHVFIYASGIVNGLVAWLTSTNIDSIPKIVIYSILGCLMIINFYWLQIWYVVSMHMLEYKHGFWQSQKEAFQMMSDNRLLVTMICLQFLVAGIATAAIYFCLQPAVQFLVKFIFWPFSLFNLAIAPVFTMIMSNFFYCWAYMMLYAWICLVTAHLYRQLVCPPSNNPSCLSCTSCEK